MEYHDWCCCLWVELIFANIGGNVILCLLGERSEMISANVGENGISCLVINCMFCLLSLTLLFLYYCSFSPGRRLKNDHKFNEEDYDDVFGPISMAQFGEIFALIEAGTAFKASVTLK